MFGFCVTLVRRSTWHVGGGDMMLQAEIQASTFFHIIIILQDNGEEGRRLPANKESLTKKRLSASEREHGKKRKNNNIVLGFFVRAGMCMPKVQRVVLPIGITMAHF